MNALRNGTRGAREFVAMKGLPIAALTSAAGAAYMIASFGTVAAPPDWSHPQRVEVRLVEYEFVPNELRFQRDVPYQLHLVNAGREGHDFTAGDFFKSVDVRNVDALSEDKASIFLNPGQTADIYFIARNVGLFAPRCADHDWAGMKATIIVD